MKRDRSLNNEQTEFSLKRFYLKDQIILQDTKQKQSDSQMNPNHFNLFDKKNIIEKVQLWLDNINTTNR